MDNGVALIIVAGITVIPAGLNWWRVSRAEKAKSKERREDRAAAAAATQVVADAANAAAERASVAAAAVETVRTDLAAQSRGVEQRLDTIHELVNSRLTRLLAANESLLAVNEEMRLLLIEWAPNDPRVQALKKEEQPP